nr:reverse transcriptase domain-containing protein [Tanacetum cinerariifolium]
MRTRNSYFPNDSSATIPRRQNKRRTLNIVKPELRTIVEMADNIQWMNYSKHPQKVQANPYHGFERENPHTHINNFKRITSTLKFRDVPNDVIKLMMFPYSLVGNARVWYDKEPPNSILTWEDLVNKFANYFFLPRKPPTSKMKSLLSLKDSRRHLERHVNDLRKCLERGNLLSKTTREALQVIENKSKVCYSRNKSNVSRMNTNSRDNAKVEESYVTCGGNHAYYNFPKPDSNQPSVCVATGTYNQVASQNCASNYMAPPVEQETDETMDKEQSNFQGSTAHIQPLVTPIPEPDVPKTLPKPNKPYLSRLNDQKLHEKATNQMVKFFQIFQNLPFDISFADALILMPKFASTIKSLLTNKEKLFELAKIPLNENCSVMLLKKLPEKLGDPGEFLIPCNFPRNGSDLRVPLILGRSFLRTGRALIDVNGEEITLRVNDEAVTFNLNQTTRYSSPYDNLSVNQIDIIDVAREEYAKEILGFSSNSLGGNPTLTFEPVLFDSSPSLTPFEGSDFILEDTNAYLKDESVSPEIDHADCDPEGDICLIEKLLNNDSFQLPPMDLKKGEVVKEKSLIEEPSELELKELPSNLEYAYLEGADKLPVIISKDLKIDEKEALLKVLKSHKRAIAWKITDIKDTMLQRCKDTNLVLNWEKCHFMVKEGIVLDHKISENGLEVDRSKVDVIAKLPYLMTVKDTPFVFSKDCIDAFDIFKKKLTEAPILVVPDWNIPFELMCDASDFAIGAVLGQRMENLAADHLSRLENPHNDVFENKDINENFPLETLSKISSRKTPWFADFSNFHAGNSIVKGMSS